MISSSLRKRFELIPKKFCGALRKCALAIAFFLVVPGLAMGADWALVTGIVFEDANLNGEFDEGEKLLSDVVVSDGRLVDKTNEQGEYRINTQVGRHVFVSVPGTHHAQGNKFYRLLEESETATPTINFPLVRNADTEDNDKFHFVFMTDTHVTELFNAKEGVAKAYNLINIIDPALVIHGGDIIIDGIKQTEQSEVEALFDLYTKDLASIIRAPFYHTVGNHDVFGWLGLPNPDPEPPLYGKKMFKKMFGPNYYSFNYKHCHFVVLDCIGLTKNLEGEAVYHGVLDSEQLDWLRSDLLKVDPESPIILISHMPMLNALQSYVGLKTETVVAPDGEKTIKHQIYGFQRLMYSILKGCNFRLALAGHYHTYEEVHWENNLHDAFFVVGGSVCGEWWKGDRRLGYETWPEGFTTIDVDGDNFDFTYVPYGWIGTQE